MPLQKIYGSRAVVKGYEYHGTKGYPLTLRLPLETYVVHSLVQ